MKVKLVKEYLDYDEEDYDEFEIANAVYSMINGDDAGSEPISKEEYDRLSNKLGYDLEELSDSETLEDMPPEELDDIYEVLSEEGYI